MSKCDCPKRLAIVLSHPTQYYSPWFRWLAQSAEINLRVFYLWNFGVTHQHDPQFSHAFAWDTDLLSGYQSEFVPNRSGDPGTHHFSGLDNPTLGQRLERWQPDAILVFGYKSVSHIRVVLWARRRDIPLIFRGDSHLLGRDGFTWTTQVLLTALYRQFSAVLPVGEANRAYFDHLDVPRHRQFRAPHSVDATLFDPAKTKYREEAAGLRHALGIPAHHLVVLFAGKLIEKKQPQQLLRAFLDLARSDATLVFVGEGPQRSTLQAAAHGRDNVHFLPFANQTQMPARYLLADVFVLPSQGTSETWGLAVNEAMHMGVPCLVSNRVGCQLDLVQDGETGWVFDVADPRALPSKLTVALDTLRIPQERAKLRARIAAKIAEYSYESAARGLLRALASVCPSGTGTRL